MVRFNNLKLIMPGLAAVLALGLVAYLVWPEPQVEGGTPGEKLTSEAPAIALEPEPRGAEAGPAESPITHRNARSSQYTPADNTKASKRSQPVPGQETYPHDVAMQQYKTALWEDIQANPPALENPHDATLDGETAYRLYMYYGNCSMAPRTQLQVDQRLEKMAKRAGEVDERYLKRLESSADRIINFYELCLAIPPDVDARMEAINWMTRAVWLGHEIAQAQFYEKIKGFMLRRDPYDNGPPLVLRHSGLVEQYKSTARYALSRALEKGHPEAYLAMSRAYYDGIIVPRDPVKAMAYSRAAEIKAGQVQVLLDRIRYQKSDIGEIVTPEQRAEAERLAQELLASS